VTEDNRLSIDPDIVSESNLACEKREIPIYDWQKEVDAMTKKFGSITLREYKLYIPY